VAIELAEAAAEGDVLLARDLLVAEQENAALQERTMDLVELGIAEWPAEIDPLDFGAERVRKGPHGNGHDADLVTLFPAYGAQRRLQRQAARLQSGAVIPGNERRSVDAAAVHDD
jgi:hypothetical protein